MAQIRLRNLTKRWGDFIAVDDFDLDIADEEFLVLLGPSGCGKSTIWQVLSHAYNKAKERHGEA